MLSVSGPSPNSTQVSLLGGSEVTLAAGEMLFACGQRKTHIYRVESGLLCVYEPSFDGVKAVADYIYPGQHAGLGFLQVHAMSARAAVETRVTCLPLDEANDAAAEDPSTADMFDRAAQAEFEARRDYLCGVGQTNPIERVAALLSNLSCSSAYEGRDPQVIDETWTSGVIADMLDMSIDELGATLSGLENMGILKYEAPAGVRILDLDALEAVADGRPSRPKLPDRFSVAA